MIGGKRVTAPNTVYFILDFDMPFHAFYWGKSQQRRFTVWMTYLRMSNFFVQFVTNLASVIIKSQPLSVTIPPHVPILKVLVHLL